MTRRRNCLGLAVMMHVNAMRAVRTGGTLAVHVASEVGLVVSGRPSVAMYAFCVAARGKGTGGPRMDGHGDGDHVGVVPEHVA